MILQLFHDFDKVVKGICTLERLFFKNHKIAVIGSGGISPITSEFDLPSAVRIFQMFSLGFNHDNPATPGHNDEIRIMIDKTIYTETFSFLIAMPEKNIIHVGDFPYKPPFKIIYFSFLTIEGVMQCGTSFRK